jgi:hypothetical protein
MTNTSIIQLTGEVPPRDRAIAEKYYDWLEDVYSSALFKYKGIKKYVNFRRIIGAEPSFVRVTPATGYPEYLSISEFNSQKDMDVFPDSPEAKYANKNNLETWGDAIDREKMWSVAYEESKTWERTLVKKGPRVIHLMATVPPLDAREKFYQWLDEELVPHIFEEFKGIAKVSNYRRIKAKLPYQPVVTEYPDYITIFEFFSRKDIEERLAHFTGVPPASKNWAAGVGEKTTWFAIYEMAKSFERQ